MPSTFPRTLLLAALHCAIASVLLQAGQGPGRFVARDNGRVRQFEISADEWHVRRSDGSSWIERQPDASSVKSRSGQPQAGVREEWSPIAYEVGKEHSDDTRRVLTRRLLVRATPGIDLEKSIAAVPGTRLVGPAPWSADWFRVDVAAASEVLTAASQLRSSPGIREVRLQLGRRREREFIPDDPFFPLQWHLRATSENGGAGGLDIGVTNVWDRFRGEGKVIGVVDDSVEIHHPDLAAGIEPTLSHDYRDGDDDPSPGDLLLDIHGTGIAGLIGARAGNGVGVAGVAPASTLAPLRLIGSDDLTDDTIGEAELFRNDVIDVKNNSWGSRTAEDLNAPATELEQALEKGVAEGRRGLGEIYVFSAGNQGNLGDDINYNMLKNRPEVIPAGAINELGEPTSYSTGGAPLVVVAPGGNAGAFSIRTTDLTGTNGLNTGSIVGELSDPDYTAAFSGTSASAPIVSGVVALMLQANPGLGWRDVQEILLRSARMLLPDDTGWATNSSGIRFHRLLGAGLVQADAAVALASSWTNLAPARKQALIAHDLAMVIPESPAPAASHTFRFDGPPLRVEHVRVTLDIAHAARGQLQVNLISPSGMASRLADRHSDRNDDYEFWTFLSRRHWGELSSGTWTVEVRDMVTRTTGTWRYARVELIGTLVGGLELAGESWIEAEGQGMRDGVISPAEVIEERVVLRNVTDRTLEGVSAELVSEDPGVSLIQARASYPPIPAGATATNLVPFTYRIDPGSAVCGGTVHLRHVAAAGGFSTTNMLARRIGIEAAPVEAAEFKGSEGLPLTVPDRGTAFATNRVEGPERIIEDVEVAIRLDHTTVGDTQISLIHPDGTEVLLSENRGGNNPNMGEGDCATGVRTVFTDLAPEPIGVGAVPFTGRFRPETPLAVLQGKPVNGEWRLRLSDVYDDDSGTLLCWSITARTRAAVTNCAAFLPLRITGFRRAEDGAFRVSGEVSPARTVTLEGSSDFVQWHEVDSRKPVESAFELVDAAAVAEERRYYRLRAQ